MFLLTDAGRDFFADSTSPFPARFHVAFAFIPPAQTDWSSAGPMEKVWTIAGITRRPTKRGISSRQQHIVTGETELAVRGGRY